MSGTRSAILAGSWYPGEPKALAAYANAARSKSKSDPFRLSAVVRSAGLYEDAEDYPRALAAYRDLMDNSDDPELVAAATGRASELAAVLK